MTKKRRSLTMACKAVVAVVVVMSTGLLVVQAADGSDAAAPASQVDDSWSAPINISSHAVFAAEPAVTTTTESLSAGALFTNLCAVCHGDAGEGGTGPSLQASHWTESATALSITNGVGSMPSFSDSLTAGQIDALAAYSVRLQTDTPSTTRTTEAPGEATAEDLYAAECAVCHGASGEGGIGPSLATSTFNSGDTVTAVSDGVGSMPGFSESLTNDEINAVSNYSVLFQGPGAGGGDEGTGDSPTASVTASAEAAGLYEANCAACHGAAGEGGIGPTLTGSGFAYDATVSAIANGIGSMPNFAGDLSDEQVNDLAAYSVAFGDGSAAAEVPASGGALPTGEGADLYEANCAACHGATGEGASAAPINVPFGNDQLVEIIEVGIADMPGFADALSDDEISVLAEYVHALALASAPVEPEPPASDEYIIAIQPSRYVEFDSDRTSIPLEPTTQLALALGSMAVLGLLILSEVFRFRRATGRPVSPEGMDPGAEA